MARTPAPRGFTRAEKRSLKFETVALVVILLVAVIAAVISYVALVWIGHEIGLGNAAYLVPFAVDGFAIACSVGIIRSQAEGEKVQGRLSEWAGLTYALGMSLAGNVVHALNAKYGTPVPEWLVWAYAAAPPIIVAYGLHVYGRAQHKGISAHVLASDPDQIHFSLAHLGDDAAQPVARKTAPTTRAATAQPRTEKRALPARKEDPYKVRARELFEEAMRANPTVKPDAAAIHRATENPANIATTRRWVQSWWEDAQTELGMSRPDPILEQVVSEDHAREVRAVG